MKKEIVIDIFKCAISRSDANNGRVGVDSISDNFTKLLDEAFKMEARSILSMIGENGIKAIDEAIKNEKSS